MPLDPSLYSWRKLSPPLWQRLALASEQMWIPRPKDLHELFISGTLKLETLVENSRLRSAARKAWRRLRFDFPELVVRGVCLDGETYMRYQTPKGEEEVSEWIQRTACFDQGREGLDFEGLRQKVLLKKQASDSEPAYLLLYSELESGDGPGVSRLHVMLNVDHEITDGIGARILFGNYLSLLASCLSTPSDDAPELIDWEKTSNNLSKPWITIMNDEQLLAGPEYEEKVQWNKSMLLERMSQNPGLALLTPPAPSSQRTHFITLTPTQTTTLLAAIKFISPNSNITHLAHAAVTLAFLRSLPPDAIPSTFYSSCWLNGRRYLLQSEIEKGYIPCCLSFAPIIFSNLQDLVLEEASKEEVKEKLVKAYTVAMQEYGKIRERKSVLSEIVSVVEDIGGMLARNSNKEAGTPSIRPSKAAPLFLSDGITEQYIEHEYFDSGKRVFEVEDVKFAANADTELIVRMSSWRGQTTISGEWNARDYDEGTIKNILKDVRDIMLSICE